MGRRNENLSVLEIGSSGEKNGRGSMKAIETFLGNLFSLLNRVSENTTTPDEVNACACGYEYVCVILL